MEIRIINTRLYSILIIIDIKTIKIDELKHSNTPVSISTIYKDSEILHTIIGIKNK